MALPEPTPDARAHSDRVAALIRGEIASSGGWISFARYMELALYAPGLGYYSAGAKKLGKAGDFVTAPEISPLYGQTLARQVKQVLEAGFDEVLEVGAGTGALAATLLEELERSGRAPRNYLILELSADLRERSRDTLAARVPHLLERVAWLNRLPPVFSGVVLGNEVLDAMPAHVVRVQSGKVEEGGVGVRNDRLTWSWRLASGGALDAARSLKLSEGFRTEIQLAAQGFMRSLSGVLEKGVAFFVDYGFPQKEYYHPQRKDGTLMCHYRHHAHADPFFLPGLQDITSHVDFSAIAGAAREGGLEVAGYTSQAQFLVNCGITEVMSRTPAEDGAKFLPLANQANRLMSPAEMGELFKVIALARGFPKPLAGFGEGDRRGARGGVMEAMQRSRTDWVKIHPLAVRITHWINVLAILIMVTSGWRIYNASPFFPFRIPSELTLGGWLAGALQWHFAAMWLLVLNGIAYVAYGIVSGHFKRKLLPITPRAVFHDVLEALRGRLAHEDLSVYNAAQRAAYLAIILCLIVLVFSGLAIWKPVQLQEITAIFGGYEGARVVHFLAMSLLVLIVLVHILMVILVPRTLPTMFSGRARRPT